jgi:hypothetical protein
MAAENAREAKTDSKRPLDRLAHGTTEDHTISKAIEVLEAAMKRAAAGRPKTGGFPYLAETLRRTGVTRNLWYLPACQSLYLTEQGSGPVAWRAAGIRYSRRSEVRPRGADRCVANRPSRAEHISRVLAGILARRSRPVRRRSQSAHLHLLRREGRGIY